MRRRALLAVLLTSAACAPMDASTPVNTQNYRVGTPRSANVGAEMIIRESSMRIDRRVWVGVLNSPDGWQRSSGYAPGSFREQLIYTGRSGSTISVGYREFRDDLARPAFFQELRYDLAGSQRIVFRNFRIRVQSADNESITFVVEDDR